MTGLLALGEFIFRGQSFYTFRRFPVLTRPFFVLPVAGSCTLLPPTTGCILGPLPWRACSPRSLRGFPPASPGQSSWTRYASDLPSRGANQAWRGASTAPVCAGLTLCRASILCQGRFLLGVLLQHLRSFPTSCLPVDFYYYGFSMMTQAELSDGGLLGALRFLFYFFLPYI